MTRRIFAERGEWLALGAAIWLGLLVRLIYVVGANFPLNDGGMFYTMVDDLLGSGYRLPRTTSYNNLSIPFAYPPMTFYATAVLHDLTGLSVVTLLRVLPLLASTLTIPAFFLLVRELLGSGRPAYVATIAFALIPRAFDWEIAGGGLTRSFGFLFAILAIHQSARLLAAHHPRAWFYSGLFGAMSLLCHPEMALFAATSHVLLMLTFRGSGRPAVLSSIKAGAVALALTSPWLIWVLAEFGADPFLSAKGSGPSTAFGPLLLMRPDVLNEPFIPTYVMFGLIGAATCIRSRSWLLPAWVLVLFAIDPRKAATEATVPIAMLVGIAFAAVEPLKPADALETGSSALRRVFNYSVFAMWLLTAVFAFRAPLSPLRSVSEDAQDSYAWIAANTSASSRFVLVTGKPWAHDAYSEWFPALSGRQSVATVQGTEWLGSTLFDNALKGHGDLQKCADRDVACLEEWETEYGKGLTHVVVATEHTFAIRKDDDECCYALRKSLEADRDYREIYTGRGAVVFERK